jgi:tRNA_anti-like
MKLRFHLLISCLAAFLAVTALSAPEPGGASLADIEAQKCQDKIGTVQRDVLNHYDEGLQELQAVFQKAADLEGALAVRAERQRLAADNSLTEKDYVNDPKALHALQVQTYAKLKELVSALIQESVPRMVEIKKSLTVAGRLDEALTVRAAIEHLQDISLLKPDAGAIVPAETLLQAFTADRPLAEKDYKGQHLIVRGALAAFRPNPTDAKIYLLYLSGGPGKIAVQCAFSTNDFRFREEKQFNSSYLVIATKENPGGVRVQLGQVIDVRGTCDGWDDLVKLAKCDLGSPGGK